MRRISMRRRAIASRAFQDNQAWTSNVRIQGFGIGRRLVGNRREGTLAVKVYIDQNGDALKHSHEIPSQVLLKGFSPNTVPIDVETIGTIRLEYDPIRYRTRPVIIGSSGSHVGVLGGTIGLLVSRAGDESTVHFMSTCHSFSLSGMAHIGDQIIQPSVQDHGVSPADAVAELSAWVAPIFSVHGFPNRADAAITRVTHPQGILPDIHLIGAPQGVAKVRRGSLVTKTGRTTARTFGVAIDLDFKYQVNWPNPTGGFSRVGFSDQVLCTRYSSDGDSGAAILNRQDRVVGLHVGGITPARKKRNHGLHG